LDRTANGTIFLFQQPPTNELRSVSAAGGEIKHFKIKNEVGRMYFGPQLFPDGRHLLCSSWGGGETKTMAHVVELDTGRITTIQENASSARYIPSGICCSSGMAICSRPGLICAN
jgi:hypothetical protein